MQEKFVITIYPKKLIFKQVNPSIENPIINSQEFNWKKGELGSIIESIVNENSAIKFFRVLISDYFCHVGSLSIEKKYIKDREYIKSKASELIPEDLNVVKWDYIVKSIVEGNAQIQVFSFSKLLNDEFKDVSFQTKEKIKLILPISIVSLESFAEEDQSFLLIYSDTFNKVIVAVIGGIVKFTSVFNENNASKKVLLSLSYLSKYLKFSPEKVVLSGDLDDNLKKELKKNFQLVDAQIIPEVNLLEVNRTAGADQKTLNISFVNIKKKGSLANLEKNLQIKKNNNSNQNLFFVIVLVTVAAMGIGMGYLFVSIILT